MIDETTYSELDLYVSGQMQGEELSAFEARMLSDTELKSEAGWLMATMVAMQTSGRQVIRQHIASAIAGVPKSEMQKYSPSKNARSFWKKWWAIAVAVIVVAAAVVVIVNKYSSSDHRTDQEGSATITDTAVSTKMNIDSLIEAMAAAPGDTGDCDAPPLTDTVNVTYADPRQQEVYYDVNEVDSARPIVMVDGYTREEQTKNRQNVRVPVMLNIRRSPPFTYTLDSVLTLNSNYMCAKKFRFTGHGDTIIMTDSVNNSYTLLRNRGKLPLVKHPPVSKK